MGEAAKISLKAIGKQDTHLLSKDPEDSFFNYDPKRHADFRKYHRSHPVLNPGVNTTWPFGQTIKVEFKPTNMGDLLSNMWLSITMPGLTNGNYADQLGRHILKSITMRVDDIEVEKIHDDWGIIYDELYLEISEKVANRFIVNRNIGYDESIPKDHIAAYETNLVVPLHFFFSRKYASDEYSSNKPNRPYFPVCAIHRQKIIFELEFHGQAFFTNTTDVLNVNTFKLITEEITLNPMERQYFATQPQKLVTDLVRKHPTTVSELTKDTIRNNLVPNIPVKCIHWFLRNTNFENEAKSVGIEPFRVGANIDGESAGDEFGRTASFSSDGTIVAVGGPKNDGTTGTYDDNRGHARVFKYVNNAWSQLGQDIDGEASDDHFGSVVSLSSDGTRVAISAPNHDSARGHVRVYAYDGTVWSKLGSDIDGVNVGDAFGSSVSLSGDGNRVAIGAPNHDSARGHVRVYEYSGGVWNLLDADIDGVATGDAFGYSVSLSGTGDRLVVGAPDHDSSRGHARVYAYSASTWSQIGADIDGLAVGDKYGSSVSLTNDGVRLVVGAPNANSDKGYVDAFYYDQEDMTLKQIGATIHGDAVNDFSGSSVSFSKDGTRIAVGSYGNGGRVRVYALNSSSQWSKVGIDIVGAYPNEFFGYVVSLNGDGRRVAIGTNITGNQQAGYVQVVAIETSDQEAFFCQNRFNFSSNLSFDQQTTFFDPIMDSASFFINGNRLPNVTNTNHNYYKYYVPFRNRLSRPIRNIYTYSFSMNPINVEPSGNLDFSQIQSDKTVIEVKLDKTKVDVSSNTYSLHMYYTGYQTFSFERGYMSISY